MIESRDESGLMVSTAETLERLAVKNVLEELEDAPKGMLLATLERGLMLEVLLLFTGVIDLLLFTKASSFFGLTFSMPTAATELLLLLTAFSEDVDTTAFTFAGVETFFLADMGE